MAGEDLRDRARPANRPGTVTDDSQNNNAVNAIIRHQCFRETEQ